LGQIWLIAERGPLPDTGSLSLFNRFFGSSQQSLMEDSLEMTLALLRQLEATVLGLKQLRGYVGQGVGQLMVEELVE
jgi:hypothetical protein